MTAQINYVLSLVTRQLSFLFFVLYGFAIKRKYRSYTMIPTLGFIGNLFLVSRFKSVSGCVMECGVWRGGMSAGMAEILGKTRHYYLFDSFEGLPEAKEIDGAAALAWQSDKESPAYHDNCAAEIGFAKDAMSKSPAKEVEFIKGWFLETLPTFNPEEKIAVLRLDGDWYDSTMQCLDSLFKHVTTGGLIIIDDYYTWDGCSRAVHDYLSKNKLPDRIRQGEGGVCYIIKE